MVSVIPKLPVVIEGCYTKRVIFLKVHTPSPDLSPAPKRVAGIEPAYTALKTAVLPLNYTF